MKKIKLLLLLLMLTGATAYSQLQQIKIVSFTVKNQLPPVIDNWANTPGSLLLVAQLPPNVRVKGIRLMVQIKGGGAIICSNNSTGGLQVDEFTTRTFSANELTSTLQGCHDLKEGSYSICVQFYNADRVAISNELCKEFSVETPREIQYTPPTLINPENDKVFTEAELSRPVTFRWTTLVPKPQQPVTYRLKVWQLMQGQSSAEAMRTNQPIVTKDVDNITQTVVNGIYTGPCKPPYLCDFVWAVEVINIDEIAGGKTYAASEQYSFKFNVATDVVAGLATADNKGNAGNTGMSGGKNLNANGDPVHGIDIKLGFDSKCDPVHGAAIRLGVIAKNANGDPVHGIDIKPGSMIKVTNANGDPVHGVDIKLGAITKSVSANGDPVHGIDIKLGVKSASANGDPVHGIDIKLGFEGKKEDVDKIQTVEIIATIRATNANGDPVHGIDIKLGVKSVNANGDPVHGVDVKLGVKSVSANGDPVHGIDIKLGATAKKQDKELDKMQPKKLQTGNDLHPVSLPIEKIVYDAGGNIIEIVLKKNTAAPSPKVVVAGSNSISGGAYQPGQPSWGDDPYKNCKTVYCHNPLHSTGCGWLECK
jgi:hypothetical protein